MELNIFFVFLLIFDFYNSSRAPRPPKGTRWVINTYPGKISSSYMQLSVSYGFTTEKINFFPFSIIMQKVIFVYDLDPQKALWGYEF